MGYEEKYRCLKGDYEKEKKGTDELLKALVQMDEAEKELWAAYDKLNISFKEQKESFDRLLEEKRVIKEKMDAYA